MPTLDARVFVTHIFQALFDIAFCVLVECVVVAMSLVLLVARIDPVLTGSIPSHLVMRIPVAYDKVVCWLLESVQVYTMAKQA
ncbi:hypothetical protein BJ741DRAFT_625474, partial [Chytriomyces cf. hyalinus JEL632]